MNAKQAREYNEAHPYTVAPCDLTRAFEARSFSTLSAARAYAASVGSRPWLIALPSGAFVEVG